MILTKDTVIRIKKKVVIWVNNEGDQEKTVEKINFKNFLYQWKDSERMQQMQMKIFIIIIMIRKINKT